MGNILPRAGLETTSLAFQARVLPLHHIGSMMSPGYPGVCVCVSVCVCVCVCGSLPQRSMQTTALIYLSQRNDIYSKPSDYAALKKEREKKGGMSLGHSSLLVHMRTSPEGSVSTTWVCDLQAH